MALTDLDDLLNDLPHNWTTARVELTIYEGADPRLGPSPASDEMVRTVSEQLTWHGARAQPSPHAGRLRLELAREPDGGRHATAALLALNGVRGDVAIVGFSTPTRALIAPAA
jgi:hypothetical protein